MRKYKNSAILATALSLMLISTGVTNAQFNLRLRITKIETDAKTVSQGQEGIVVTMEVQNNGLSAITNIEAVLVFLGENSTEGDLSHEYSQDRTDTITEIPPRSKVTLSFEVGVSKSATIGKITIDGRVSGTSVGFPVSVDTADKTAAWSVVRAASLLAQSVEGSVATASSGQTGLTFTSVIANPGGAAAVIEDVRLKFLYEGASDRSGDFSATPADNNPTSLNPGKTDRFEFSVDVLPTAQAGNYVVDIEVVGRDENSGVRISDPGADTPAGLAIQEPARLEVSIQVDPFQTVNDTFLVQANVRNLGDAEIDDSGELFLDVPVEAGYTLMPQTPATQSFQVDVAVTWQVLAPPVATILDTFIVEISTIPLENISGLPALIETGSDTAEVKTFDDGTGGNATIVIDSVRIKDPPGARDGVLSTDQELTVTAFFHQTNAIDINATIFFTTGGYGFGSGDDFTKTVNDTAEFTSLSWNLEAPRNPQPGHYIYIRATGIDKETNSLIEDVAPDTVRARDSESPITIRVVSKANLNLTAQITAPPSAMDSVLTIDQFFTITARLNNLGTAEMEGDAGLSITLPPGFSTLDPLTEIINTTSTNEASWEIQAPDQETGISIITVRAVEPFATDVNSNAPVAFAQTERLIPVLVTESICVITTVLSERKPLTVVKGSQDISMMGLTFENTGDNEVSILGVKIWITDKDRQDITPATVISNLRVTDYSNSNTTFAEISQLPASNPVEIAFNPGITIRPQKSQSIEFRVDISYLTSQETLQLMVRTPADAITAVDADQISADIKAEDCLALGAYLTSGSSNINDSGFNANFFNFPNPFGSEEPETRFHYFLEHDSDVTLRIYTLLGELVWSRSYNAQQTEGKAGLHDGNTLGSIIWDGTNDKGKKVLNGVYIAILKANGRQAVTKIAIAK